MDDAATQVVPPTSTAEVAFPADATLMMLAPLLLLSAYGRKRKGRAWLGTIGGALLVLSLVFLGMSLAPDTALAAGRPALLFPGPGGTTYRLASVPAAMPESAPVAGPSEAPAAQHTTQISTTQVISYTYGPLGRLTDASYSTGEYFGYVYDAVGNRTTLTTTTPITGTTITTYIYDAANRLTAVDGAPYTWDARGNLVSNGTFIYTYNTAGRMVSATSPTTVISYMYTGDGVRVGMNEDGQATTYVQDVALGLPQVLVKSNDDGTTQYLYGLGRLMQVQDGDTDWFLGDALGSVRQLVDAAGEVGLARIYTPYGQVLSESGEGSSEYGFTGEQWDSYIKLIYLRSRYYAPETGRFLAKDPWAGNLIQPWTKHGWSYVGNNPINFTDPSGLCHPNDVTCHRIARDIYRDYNVIVEGGDFDKHYLMSCRDDSMRKGVATNWQWDELSAVDASLRLMKTFLNAGYRTFETTVGKGQTSFRRVMVNSVGKTNSVTRPSFSSLAEPLAVRVELDDTLFSEPTLPGRVAPIFHELFHVYDLQIPGSQTFLTMIRSQPPWNTTLVPGPGGRCGPTRYACSDAAENFADSAVIYALNWLQNLAPNSEDRYLAKLVLQRYPDAGAGMTGNQPIRDPNLWQDEGLRVWNMNRLFFGYYSPSVPWDEQHSNQLGISPYDPRLGWIPFEW